MQAETLILMLWGVALTAFTAVMVYRAMLTQYETDELFLDDLADHSFRKCSHESIVRRVNSITPFARGTGGALCFMTLVMVAVFFVENASYIKF